MDLRGPVRECRSMIVNLTFGKNLIHVLLLDKMSGTYIPAFNSLIRQHFKAMLALHRLETFHFIFFDRCGELDFPFLKFFILFDRHLYIRVEYFLFVNLDGN